MSLSRLNNPDYYFEIESISKVEFQKLMQPFDKSKAIKSDLDDIHKIEHLLHLSKGILANEEFYVAEQTCKCGKTVKFSDIVSTALSSGHPASFLVHTILGSKYIVQPAFGKIKCSGCAEIMEGSFYEVRNYGCSGTRHPY